MSFTRTPKGLAAKYMFYKVPTIWVEGPTDTYFYKPLLASIPCRFEIFDGKENSDELIFAMVEADLPYVVIVDGDYEMLTRKRSAHRRVIMLNRYSIENYLWEKTIVEEVCLDYSRCGEYEEILGNDYENALADVISHLYDTIILDVTSRRSENAIRVLPQRPDRLLNGVVNVDFNKSRIKILNDKARSKYTTEEIGASKMLVDEFLQTRRLIDLLRGHFSFGLLRRIFMKAIKRKRGKKPNIEDDAIFQLLSIKTWQKTRSVDHKKLKAKVLRAVRESQSALI